MNILLNNKKFFVSTIVFFVVFLPIISFAAYQVVTCDGSDASPCDFDAFIDMVNGLIDWFVTISVSIAAVTFAMAGGRILLNPDNPGERAKAKDMFRKTIYGLIALLSCWLIVYVIIGALTNNAGDYLRFFAN